MSIQVQEFVIFGGKKVTVDGEVYSSVYTGFLPDEEDKANGMRGYQVAKTACDPAVVDALPTDGEYPITVKVNVKMKMKGQVMTSHLLSIVDEKPVLNKDKK